MNRSLWTTVLIAGAAVGRAAGAPRAAVACGATPCSTATNVCCVTPGDGGMGFAFTCESASTCSAGGNGVALQCAATADCPMGQVCCIDAAGMSSSCATMCGAGGGQLCDPNAPNNGGCPQGTTCQTGQVDALPMSYGTCG